MKPISLISFGAEIDPLRSAVPISKHIVAKTGVRFKNGQRCSLVALDAVIIHTQELSASNAPSLDAALTLHGETRPTHSKGVSRLVQQPKSACATNTVCLVRENTTFSVRALQGYDRVLSSYDYVHA